jgi:hypothetical protein
LNKPKTKSREEFWRDYEASLGEKVLAYKLGKYLSGWDEFDGELWGLLIATSGGFRFHHFPHEGWFDAVARVTMGGEVPKEKTLFIPTASILGVELRREKSLLRRIFLPRSPFLLLRYRGEDGAERELAAETDSEGEAFAAELRALITP